MCSICDSLFIRDEASCKRIVGEEKVILLNDSEDPRCCVGFNSVSNCCCGIFASPCIDGLIRQKAFYGNMRKREEDTCSCLRCDYFYPCVITDSCCVNTFISICSGFFCGNLSIFIDEFRVAYPWYLINQQAEGTRSSGSILVESACCDPCVCLMCRKSHYVRNSKDYTSEHNPNAGRTCPKGNARTVVSFASSSPQTGKNSVAVSATFVDT